MGQRVCNDSVYYMPQIGHHTGPRNGGNNCIIMSPFAKYYKSLQQNVFVSNAHV